MAWKFASVTSACDIIVIWFHFEETAYKIPRLDSHSVVGGRPPGICQPGSENCRKLTIEPDPAAAAWSVCSDHSTLLGVDPHVRES